MYLCKCLPLMLDILSSNFLIHGEPFLGVFVLYFFPELLFVIFVCVHSLLISLFVICYFLRPLAGSGAWRHHLGDKSPPHPSSLAPSYSHLLSILICISLYFSYFSYYISHIFHTIFSHFSYHIFRISHPTSLAPSYLVFRGLVRFPNPSYDQSGDLTKN